MDYLSSKPFWFRLVRVMLLQKYKKGDVFPVPRFELKGADVRKFVGELKDFHGLFEGCFARSEPGEHFYRYMVGLFSRLERKSAEPIANAVEGGKVRDTQRLLSDYKWDEREMRRRYHRRVAEEMGDDRGVVILDEVGFPKAGHDSAGVAPQYCGAEGKVDNCQVGVFAAYASPHGYALLDKRLFLPEQWFGPDYAQRRKKCRIPDDLPFKTKPRLAAEMFQDLVCERIIPFKYVTGDTVYGNNPDFVGALEAEGRRIYFLAVPCDTRCVLKQPLVVEMEYRYKGKKRVKKQVVKWSDKPVRVDKLAQHISRSHWFRRMVEEGAKGPVVYEFAKREVILCHGNLPTRTVWLVIKRTLGDDPAYTYYISNAPHSTRLSAFVWLSGMRWPIEQCFEETKGELGLDQYEVRKYPGWNHHMLSCMLAHFFLWHLRIKLGGKITGYYATAA